MNQAIHTHIAHALSRRQPIVLSDFDGTLCDEYAYDIASNNHFPVVREAIIQAASRSPLIVATARRATHPAIEYMWDCGLVRRTMPIISENGGIIHIYSDNGIRKERIAPEGSTRDIDQWLSKVIAKVGAAPAGTQLRLKRGETMIIARYQDTDGHTQRLHQEMLLHQLRSLSPPQWLSLSLSGESVCLQHVSVSKAVAFKKVLAYINARREDVFVIGLGNADNDRPLFDEADFSVGVDESVGKAVDLSLTDGVNSSLSVLASLPSAYAVRRTT